MTGPRDERDPGRRAVAAACLLALLALAVRLAYLLTVVRRPGYRWIDPDRYVEMGRLLVTPEGGWRWTLDAILYLKHVKAPLYPPAPW